MYPGIRSPAAEGFHRFAQNSCQGFMQHLLHADRIFLHLPAMIAGPIISQFNKIALFSGHRGKDNEPLTNTVHNLVKLNIIEEALKALGYLHLTF